MAAVFELRSKEDGTHSEAGEPRTRQSSAERSWCPNVVLSFPKFLEFQYREDHSSNFVTVSWIIGQGKHQEVATSVKGSVQYKDENARWQST